MIEQAKYGPFFDGYVAAVDRTRIGRAAYSEDSFDVCTDPKSGDIVNRPGSDTVFSETTSPTGMLELAFGERIRQVMALSSESFTDGQPNLACLYTDDTDKEGTLVWRSSNGNTYQQIGKSYGTTHRSATVLTEWNFLMIPLRTEHATDKWTRCKDTAQRKVLFAGSRRALRIGTALIAPNRYGTPIYWNGRFNDAVGAGSEKEFVRPLGPMPPIFPIRRSAVPATSAGTWVGTDTAYWSYAYRYANGDVSAPMLCQTTDVITISTGVATQFPYVDVIVPPGPPDVVERYVFRTNKWTESTGTPEDPEALLLTGTIKNNTQTTYRDYGGDDSSLRERPDLVRWDLMMPPRARTCWTMDSRIVFADLAVNPSVIELAPYTTNGSLNELWPATGSTAAYAGLNGYAFWNNDGTTLRLIHTPKPGAGLLDHSFTLANYSLQGLVDAINATAGNYKWRAQLLPGADGNAPAADLETTSGTDWFDDDAAAAYAAAPTSGWCRVILGQGLPGVLFMKNTSAFCNAGTDRRALHFTIANPSGTSTESDAPLGPNAWRGSYDCRRRLEGGMGRIIGGGSLLDGCLVVASAGIGVLRNVRGGKTGIDADYRLEKWKQGSGGISWAGIAEGDGWVVYMSRKGLMVNDGKREVCISTRVWSQRSKNDAGSGPWAYEVGECKKWVGADNDGCQFHVAVANSRIYVSYRSSGSVSYPDRYMFYDFSGGLNELGVDQVLRDDGTPFAWSAPCRIPVSAIGVVTRSDGDHVYGVVDGYAKGRVLEVDKAGTWLDAGSAGMSCVAYLQTDRFDATRQKKRVSKVDVEYYNAADDTSVSAASDFARTTNTLLQVLPGVADGLISDIARLRPRSPLSAPVEQFELKLHGTPTERVGFRTVEVEFRRLSTTSP